MNDPKTGQIKGADWRWNIIRERRADFDGAFYFAVKTTGVFCRPSCKARTPKPENVAFYESIADAEMAGFRACLRCKPKNEYHAGPEAELIIKAFSIIGDPENEFLTIGQLSKNLGKSAGHLQKTFRKILGLTPKEVLDMKRLTAFRKNVSGSDVTTSLYDSGFGSSRSLYEKAGETLGMTPATYKKGGRNMHIFYTVTDSKLGKLLVAATGKGICSVSFGDTEVELEQELRKEFWAATFERDDKGLNQSVRTILKSLEGEKAILSLPLDLRASAFQMRVWAELRKIPYGQTRSYSEIARSLGNSNAVRAVARACATNPVALVNPCHRVIAANGGLSGYRWGLERKEQLLKREKETSEKAKRKAA